MNIKSKLIGTKDFYKRVIAIVLPMIIQNTITNVVSLLDNVMVGQLGTLQMSAVAIVNQLIFVFNLCIFGGLAGAGIFSTQYAGIDDHNGIRHCFRAKTVIGIVIFTLSLIVFLSFPRPLINMYLNEGTSAEDAALTLKYALSYLNIMLIGLLPFTLTQIYSSSLREIGETKLPMIASVIAIFINLIFNYLLIYGKFGFPKLGVIGAAAATVLARFVEAIIVIVIATKRRKKYRFLKSAFKSLYVPLDLCKKIFIKGFPLLINEFLWAAGMAVLLQCYSVRGLEVVAALNIANTVNNLFSVVFITMGSAVAIIVGQHLGANEIEKAKNAVWQLITLAVACCVVIGSVMAAFANSIPNLYNTNPEVREMATTFLYIIAFFMPIYAFAHNCYFTLRSGGRTIITFLFDSACTWGICVPCAFILSKFTSLPIVPLYFAVQSLEFIKCIVGFIMIKKGLWIRNIIEDKNNA
jgi:putative MATE family efflux protein